MATTTRDPSVAPETAVPRLVPWIGLGGAMVVLAASAFLPTLLGWQVYSRAHPEDVVGAINPLHAIWDPLLIGPGTLPAVVLAVLGWRYAADLATRLPWRRLLGASYVVSAAWMVSLALVSGMDGIARPLDHSYEYLETARGLTDIPAFLSEFVSRIPIGATDNWPTHVAGHPPGATLFFVVLARIGLGSGLAAGIVVIAISASTAAAVLVTVRALGAEDAARRVAPLLVLTPAAVYMAVSADAVFAATAAWGMAALALSATAATRGRLVGFGVVSGLLLGSCMMFSYGLPLLGLLAVAVLVAGPQLAAPADRGGLGPGRRARLRAVRLPLVGGLPRADRALLGRDRLQAPRRLLDLGRPRLVPVLRRTAPRCRGRGPSLAGRPPPPRPARGAAARRRGGGDRAGRDLLADEPGRGRADLAAVRAVGDPVAALLPERWRRHGLALQLVTALLVEHLLYTGW